MHPRVAHRWYQVCRLATWAFMTCFGSMRAKGQGNVPKTGPVLLLANHCSFLDPPLVGAAVTRQVSQMARKTLFDNKILKELITSLDAFPVESKGFSREGLMTMIGKIEQGKVVSMFPEGERSHDGEMQEFKPGLLLLLKKAKCPIVPVGIVGTFETWSRHQKFPSLCTIFTPPDKRCLAVSIGKPIMPEVYSKWSREEILQKLFDLVKIEEEEARKLQRKKRD